MPTMNRVDMMNCAAGHHDFSDDASECHVCGFAEAEASAPAANLPAFVYILTIDHRHGTNTSAHRTNEGATADLAAFCRQYAEDDAFILNADKMTDDEIIEAYFAVMNERDEFYTVERVELLA